MLESEIKKLTAAVEALTAQLQSGPALFETTKEVVENIEDTIEAPEPELEAPEEGPEPGAMDPEDYTVAACKKLAREKIVDGLDKAKVKKLITDLGGDSIVDLDDDQRKKFISKMEAI